MNHVQRAGLPRLLCNKPKEEEEEALNLQKNCSLERARRDDAARRRSCWAHMHNLGEYVGPDALSQDGVQRVVVKERAGPGNKFCFKGDMSFLSTVYPYLCHSCLELETTSRGSTEGAAFVGGQRGKSGRVSPGHAHVLRKLPPNPRY